LYIFFGAVVYGLTAWIGGIRPQHFYRGAH